MFLYALYVCLCILASCVSLYNRKRDVHHLGSSQIRGWKNKTKNSWMMSSPSMAPLMVNNVWLHPSHRITVWGCLLLAPSAMCVIPNLSPKPSTHHMHDPGSIVPHIRPKVFTDNQMPWIKYNYYYINNASKDYDDTQRNRIAEDSITPQEWQQG
jgi:hypothetical protein